MLVFSFKHSLCEHRIRFDASFIWFMFTLCDIWHEAKTVPKPVFEANRSQILCWLFWTRKRKKCFHLGALLISCFVLLQLASYLFCYFCLISFFSILFLVCFNIPFWAAASMGRCPVGHRGKNHVRPSVRTSPPMLLNGITWIIDKMQTYHWISWKIYRKIKKCQLPNEWYGKLAKNRNMHNSEWIT